MRRFKDLVQAILSYVERYSGPPPIEVPEIPSFDQLQVHYHVGLCSEAGFLHVKEIPNPNGCWKQYEIINLTWQGHEALDKLKNGATFRDLNNPQY